MIKRRTLIASIGAVAGTTLGAAAYSSVTVDRSATIDVVTDETGLIGLGTGTSGELITQEADGTLAIDLTKGTASGMNADSTLTFGSESDAGGSYAFTVTNNDTTARDVTLNFIEVANDTATGTPNVQFKVYDNTGAPVEEDADGNVTSIASEEAGYTIGTAAAGTPYHIVLVIDTAGLTADADFTGTLSITA